MSISILNYVPRLTTYTFIPFVSFNIPIDVKNVSVDLDISYASAFITIRDINVTVLTNANYINIKTEHSLCKFIWSKDGAYIR